MPYSMPSREIEECIRDCGECSGVCIRTAHHCLHVGNAHAAPEHQGRIRDCAQICSTAVGFMARGSPYAAAICRQCAEICAACAEDCDKLAENDGMMKHCAQVCRACAQSCERMASVVV
ncbi:putative cysteine-rich protein YhjQ [Phycisphaerales bacterium]|nr:putative cysteine-rich protein YhjQ [Phycisphaerales bacterium]